jgi:hypothetical protein
MNFFHHGISEFLFGLISTTYKISGSGTRFSYVTVEIEKALLVRRDAARSGATSDAQYREGNLSSDRLRRATFAAC